MSPLGENSASPMRFINQRITCNQKELGSVLDRGSTRNEKNMNIAKVASTLLTALAIGGAAGSADALTTCDHGEKLLNQPLDLACSGGFSSTHIANASPKRVIALLKTGTGGLAKSFGLDVNGTLTGTRCLAFDSLGGTSTQSDPGKCDGTEHPLAKVGGILQKP